MCGIIGRPSLSLSLLRVAQEKRKGWTCAGQKRKKKKRKRRGWFVSLTSMVVDRVSFLAGEFVFVVGRTPAWHNKNLGGGEIFLRLTCHSQESRLDVSLCRRWIADMKEMKGVFGLVWFQTFFRYEMEVFFFFRARLEEA